MRIRDRPPAHFLRCLIHVVFVQAQLRAGIFAFVIARFPIFRERDSFFDRPSLTFLNLESKKERLEEEEKVVRGDSATGKSTLFVFKDLALK